MPTNAKRWTAPVAIFIVAFSLRLVYVWQIRYSALFSMLMGDARGYDTWAQRIASGDWIGHDVFYQAPLYPYFLGIVQLFAGKPEYCRIINRMRTLDPKDWRRARGGSAKALFSGVWPHSWR